MNVCQPTDRQLIISTPNPLATHFSVLDILDPIPPFKEQSTSLIDFGNRRIGLSKTQESQRSNGVGSEAMQKPTRQQHVPTHSIALAYPLQTGTHFLKLGCLLKHVNFQTRSTHGASCCQSSHPSADNRD